MVHPQAKALAYLERIQKNTYDALGIVPNWLSEDNSRFQNEFLQEFYEGVVRHSGKSFDEFMKEFLGETRRESPSAYQNPNLFDMLAGMAEEIEEILNARKIPLDPKPIIGTLPTGRVNGIALKVPDTDQIIVLIEDGLFGFANLAAKVVCRAFPILGEEDGHLNFSTDDDGWRKELSAKPEISERFVELLFAYLIGGHPHMARPYLPEPKYDGITHVLRHSMELFVLGHEYGHFISGHLNVGSTRKAMIAGSSADEVETNWIQEIEADVRGVELMVAAMGKKGYDLSLSFWGADFFFGCIEVVERAISIVQTGEVKPQYSATHPPTEIRRESLHRTLRNSVGEEANGPLHLCGVVKAILDQLWLACELPLMTAYKKRVPLSVAWRQ